MVIGNTAAGHLYSRLVPLVLLLIDGNSLLALVCREYAIFIVSFLAVQVFDSEKLYFLTQVAIPLMLMIQDGNCMS